MLSIIIAVVAAGLVYSIYRLVRGPRPKVRRLSEKELQRPGAPENPLKKSLYIASVPQEAAFIKAFGPNYLDPKIISSDISEEELATMKQDELCWVAEQVGTDEVLLERIKKVLDNKKNEGKP